MPEYRVTDGGVAVATCKGCPNETIYIGDYCSDCQVDLHLGLPPGSHWPETHGEPLPTAPPTDGEDGQS